MLDRLQEEQRQGAKNSRQFSQCHTIALTEPHTAPRVLTNQ